MTLRPYVISFVVLSLFACGPATPPSGQNKASSGATSSCSATSEAGQSCKISCNAPQAAVCDRGTGGAQPSCVCK